LRGRSFTSFGINSGRSRRSGVDGKLIIEDRMIVLQRRIDEGIMAGRLPRVQGREFLQQIKRRKEQRFPECNKGLPSFLKSVKRSP